MSATKKLFIQWNILFAELVILAGVFHFFQHQNHGTTLDYFPWLLSLSFALITNTLLRYRQAPMNFVLIYNGLISICAGILGQHSLVMPEESLFSRVFFFIFLTCSTAHAAMLVEDEPKQSQIVLYIDILVITTIIMFILRHTGTLTDIDVLIRLCQLSCAGMLLSMIIFRLQFPNSKSGSGSKLRGMFLPGLIFIMLLAIAWFASNNSEGASFGIATAIIYIKDLVLAALMLLVKLMARFFNWFIMLFPAASETIVLPEAGEDIVIESLAGEASADGSLLFIIAAAAIITVIIVIILKMRGKRWRNNLQASTVRKEQYRISHLKKGVRMFWKKITQKLIFQMAYFRNRKSAAGLFVWTERKMRRRNISRSVNESPSAWLRRLAASDQGKLGPGDAEDAGDTTCAADTTSALVYATSEESVSALLNTLAEHLEKQYYQNISLPLPEGFFRLYRRTIADKATSLSEVNRL